MKTLLNELAVIRKVHKKYPMNLIYTTSINEQFNSKTVAIIGL